MRAWPFLLRPRLASAKRMPYHKEMSIPCLNVSRRPTARPAARNLARILSARERTWRNAL